MITFIDKTRRLQIGSKLASTLFSDLVLRYAGQLLPAARYAQCEMPTALCHFRETGLISLLPARRSRWWTAVAHCLNHRPWIPFDIPLMLHPSARLNYEEGYYGT